MSAGSLFQCLHSMRKMKIHIPLYIICCLLFLTCTKFIVKFMYNRLDKHIAHQVEKFYDTDSAQYDFVLRRARFHLKWHKQSELPAYEQTLRALGRKFQHNITHEDLDWFYNSLFHFRDRIYERIMPDMVEFLSSVKTEQVLNLKKELSEHMSQYRDKLRVPDEKRLKERNEKLMDLIEDWCGDFSKEQEAKIYLYLSEYPDFLREWIDFISEKQNSFVKFMLQQPVKEQIQQYLTESLITSEALTISLKNPKTRRWHDATGDFVIKIYSILTVEQKLHLQAKCNEFADYLLNIRKS